MFIIFSLSSITTKISEILTTNQISNISSLYLTIDFCFILCSNIIFFILITREKKDWLFFSKVFQTWQTLPFLSKIMCASFIFTFGIPNKIWVNQKMPTLVRIVLIVFVKFMGVFYPILDFILIFYFVFAAESNTFRILYNKVGVFRGYFDFWFFSGEKNSKIKIEVLNYLFEDISTKGSANLTQLLGGSIFAIGLDLGARWERENGGNKALIDISYLEKFCSEPYPNGIQGRIDLFNALMESNLVEEPIYGLFKCVVVKDSLEKILRKELPEIFIPENIAIILRDRPDMVYMFEIEASWWDCLWDEEDPTAPF